MINYISRKIGIYTSNIFRPSPTHFYFYLKNGVKNRVNNVSSLTLLHFLPYFFTPKSIFLEYSIFINYVTVFQVFSIYLIFLYEFDK